MTDATRRLLMTSLRLFDLAMLVMAFGLATCTVVGNLKPISGPDFVSMRLSISNVLIFLLTLVAASIVFASCGLYQSKRLTSMHLEMTEIVKATSIFTCVLVLFAITFRIRMLTPAYFAVYWTFASALILGGRVGRRYVLGGIRRRGRNLRHILVLGTNDRALDFARKLESRPELGYRLLGFVDSDWQGRATFLQGGGKLCCDFGQLGEFFRRNVVDEVAIYLPLRSFYELALEVARLCEQHGIVVRMNSDIFSLGIAHSRAEVLDDDLQMTTYSYLDAYYGWPGVLKRAIDVLASISLLILLFPLLLVVGAVIKLTSPGPIFFRQERVGLNKRRFFILKFRTMVNGAERMMTELEGLNEASGPVFKIKNDPRITLVGTFLRRASIDELPQLVNVLRGDMSLVGPRPLPLRDYEGFNQDWQRRRFTVRPGITCLWQIHGRGSIPFDRWMELDIQYLNDWSLWLDIKILARTIPAVLRGTGAA
jgi:exopolysaccharide biosynthesis polyprenyl glycosylphosphotransferase